MPSTIFSRVLGLRLHLIRVGEDLALRGHDVLRNVVPADPLRRRRGDVHGDLARELGRAAAHLDEHAELVRWWMRVALDPAAVDGLETGGADDGDVLAELAGQLQPLLLELLRCAWALGLDGLQHLLCEGEELVVVRDGLGLAADGHDRAAPALVADPVADLPLGRLAAGALLRARDAALAEDPLRGLDVSVRLLSARLQSIIGAPV